MTTRLPLMQMLGLSLAQGFTLAGVWLAFEHDTALAQYPPLFVPLCTFAVAWPVLVLLGVETTNLKRTLGYATGFAAVLTMLGAYIGWQAMPYGMFPVTTLLVTYGLTSIVASFFALCYLQQWQRGEPIRYEALFANAWRNLLVVGLSGATVGVVMLLLTLTAALFDVIGIDLAELFSEPWFIVPVICVTFGGGIAACRRRIDLVDAITGLLQGLTRYLLPLVLLVVLVFLCTLPFTGLGPLWDTGHGSVILLVLGGVGLVLVNAVYQAGREAAYRLVAHGFVSVGVVLLPAISALAIYGVGVRVSQYGWTVERCWAFTGAVMSGLVSVGYALAVFIRRGRWNTALAPLNTIGGVLVVAVMLVTNSPLLDFRSISMTSQLARVERGELETLAFDFYYAREFLARPGYLKTRPLVEELGFEPAAESPATFIAGVVEKEDADSASRSREFWDAVVYRPGELQVPTAVRRLIEETMLHIESPVLIALDLNGDGEEEYAVLGAYRVQRPDFASADSPLPVVVGDGAVSLQGEEAEKAMRLLEDSLVDYHRPVGYVVHRDAGDWKYKMLRLRSGQWLSDERDPDVIPATLRQGEIQPVTPEFDDLRVGNLLFDVPDADAWSESEADPVDVVNESGGSLER